MKYTLAIIALCATASSIELNKHKRHQHKFAEGQGQDEFNGESIKMKGSKGMETYSHAQKRSNQELLQMYMQEGSAAPTVRGEKQW